MVIWFCNSVDFYSISMTEDQHTSSEYLCLQIAIDLSWFAFNRILFILFDFNASVTFILLTKISTSIHFPSFLVFSLLFSSRLFCSFQMIYHYFFSNNSRYLVQDPYPHDSRCGCPICPDCRYQQPCGGLGYSGSSCDGSCVVCTGLVPPGPLEITPKI